MSLRFYELYFPSELTAESVLALTRTLAVRPRRGLFTRADPVLLEVRSEGGQLTWRLGVTKREHNTVIAGVRSSIPDVHLEPATDSAHDGMQAFELRLSSPKRSLRTDHPEEVASTLLHALHRTYRGEVVVLQWLVGPWLHRPVVRPPARVRKASSVSLSDLGTLTLDAEQTKALRDKQSEPLFGVVGRLGVHASVRAREGVLRQGVIGALQLLRAPGVGFDRRLTPTWLVSRRLRRYQTPTFAFPIVLNARELMSCLGWPIGNPVLPSVSYSGHRHLPAVHGTLRSEAEVAAHPERFRVTGRSTFAGQEGLVVQRSRDALMHTAVVGPTGSGKSVWLSRMALQDITAGRGVVVIDPKRDLVEAIADRLPQERLDDVVLLDPTDEVPVGINVLRSAEPDLAVDLVLHVLHELYSANWGPRTAYVLHNALMTLTRHGGLTLCELPPLLLNPAFRRQVLSSVPSDAFGVAGFWQWFESLSDQERATVVGPVINKVAGFVSRAPMRGVIGQTKGFDLSEVFTSRKVLLVSLSKGSLGSENAHLLGALLLGALWSQIQQRNRVDQDKRAPVFVYLDEFADVLRLPLDLGDALVQARGLGVGLYLAYQHRGLLPSSMRSAVDANARSKVVFQCGYDDATAFAKVLGGGLTPNDLQGLAAFETYQALCVEGRTASPASVATLPLPRATGSRAEVLRRSREQHGMTRTDVDAALLARRQATKQSSAPVGTRRRGGMS